MAAVEGRQLVEDIMPALDAGMAKYLPAGDHLEGDAAEAQANLDAGVPRVLALGGPLRRQPLEVVVAHDQVVGDAQDGGAEGAAAVSHQRTVGAIHLITLVA